MLAEFHPLAEIHESAGLFQGKAQPEEFAENNLRDESSCSEANSSEQIPYNHVHALAMHI